MLVGTLGTSRLPAVPQDYYCSLEYLDLTSHRRVRLMHQWFLFHSEPALQRNLAKISSFSETPVKIHQCMG